MAIGEDDAEFMDDGEEQGQLPEPTLGNVRIVIQGAPSEPLVLDALVRLLLGSAIEGGDQLARRIKDWDVETDGRGSEIYSELPDETDAERLRYALLGVLSKAPDLAQAALSTAVDVSDSAYRLLSNLLSPVTSSRLMRPAQRGYNKLAARGEVQVEAWIDAGRRAEQHSRALARQAAFDGTDEAIDEMVGILAQKPEVRDLVTQQSVGMAQEVMNVVRQRTAAEDTRWERRVRSLLRRR